MLIRKGFWLKCLYAFLTPVIYSSVNVHLQISAGSLYFLSCWETLLLESSANFGELWDILVLKELLGFEVPEGFFQWLANRSPILRGRIGVAVEDCSTMSSNHKRCVVDVDYSPCAEAVALSFLSLTLFFLSYQSWLGFSGGIEFKGKQGQKETF